MIYYWVRLKGFFVVARLSAIFSENCSEADSGRPWSSRGKFKTVYAIFVQLSTYSVDIAQEIEQWAAQASVARSACFSISVRHPPLYKFAILDLCISTERGVLSVARCCYVFPCELRGPAWAVGNYSISQSAGGTSQNIIFKTLRQIGRGAPLCTRGGKKEP